MRATIRMADGSLVEGEVVAMGNWLPPTVNAAGCAGNPAVNVFAFPVPNVMQFQPLPMLPPPTAACAAQPTAFSIFTIPAQ